MGSRVPEGALDALIRRELLSLASGSTSTVAPRRERGRRGGAWPRCKDEAQEPSDEDQRQR